MARLRIQEEKEKKGGHTDPPLRAETMILQGTACVSSRAFTNEKPKTLDARSRSGMTEGDVGDCKCSLIRWRKEETGMFRTDVSKKMGEPVRLPHSH